MIRKCANPNCDTEFFHSREGHLFAYEIKKPEEPCRDVPAVICEKKFGRATVYFWLCAQCCDQFVLHFTVSTGVTLVPSSKRDADRQLHSQSNTPRDPEAVEQRDMHD